MRAPNFTKDYTKGLTKILKSVKIAVLQEEETLFHLIDVEGNERAFQEPFLLLYYAHNKTGATLWQILFGYIPKERLIQSVQFKVQSDKRGRIYLPKIGCFKTDYPSSKLYFEYNCLTKSYQIKNQNGVVATSLVPNLRTANQQTTFYAFEHDYFEIAFKPYNRLNKKAHKPTNPLYQYNFGTFNRAYKLLQHTNCNYFEMLLHALTGVYNFHSDHYPSFSDRRCYGIAFLSGTRKDSVVYFLVELAQQTGHTIFNTILQNRQDYFAIDIHTPRSALTNNADDNSHVYDAFHGLYTAVKVAETLDYFIKKPQLFSDSENHEIKGRLLANSHRYKMGFYRMDVNRVFSAKGLLNYQKLDNYLQSLYHKHAKLLAEFPYVPDGVVFNFSKFLKQFPLKKK
ncbi:hypothetical protein [Flavobacterium sp. JP2137]|uniref:hypothetical protein n=1 Tax=Flavobacterium sp. JP2137 TaxID=3414510 RepID=UPI003D2FEBF5